MGNNFSTVHMRLAIRCSFVVVLLVAAKNFDASLQLDHKIEGLRNIVNRA